MYSVCLAVRCRAVGEKCIKNPENDPLENDVSFVLQEPEPLQYPHRPSTSMDTTTINPGTSTSRVSRLGMIRVYSITV
jgi:hypothetical protein